MSINKCAYIDALIEIKEWSPAIGNVGGKFAIDTETTFLTGNKIPEFVIASVYTGDTCYIIPHQHITSFMEIHLHSKMIMHTSQFDIHVIEKATGIKLTNAIDDNKITDIALLYQLIELARTGDTPWKYNLTLLSEKYLGFKLDKELADDQGELFRTNYGQYLDTGFVDLNLLPAPAIEYAALDAIVTWYIYQELLKQNINLLNSDDPLTHSIQLKAAYALAVVERYGCKIDQSKVNELQIKATEKIKETLTSLKAMGWQPDDGQAGYNSVIEQLEQEHNFKLPRTNKTGKASAAKDVLKKYLHIPFIREYTRLQSIQKSKSTFINSLMSKNVVHPHFRVLVSTGRTASFNPNFQNYPRSGQIRECFIPRDGYKYIIADYSTVELCTLAQTCLSLFGKSRMAELINAGVDLHTWFASQILKKPQEQVAKQERMYAKACNFGFPGGLGVKIFLDYAQNSYGISGLDFNKAQQLRHLWMNAFPEMKRYLSAFDQNSNRRFTAKTLTGRIRGNCYYTQAKNFYFQGLASDGAKLALYNLIQSGFRVVNFIHDEFVVEVKDNETIEANGSQIEEIMVSEMKRVCPDVKVSVEWGIYECWKKI